MPVTLLWFKIQVSCSFPRHLYEIYFPSLITSQAEGFLRPVFLASSILRCIFGATGTRDITESFKRDNKTRGGKFGSWTVVSVCGICRCLAAPIQRQPFRLKEQMCSQILSLKSPHYKYLRCSKTCVTELLLLCFWRSVLFISFIALGAGCEDTVQPGKIKIRSVSSLLLCGFSCCVSPCSAAPLPEPELQWAKCSAERFCKVWDLSCIWAQRDPSGTVHRHLQMLCHWYFSDLSCCHVCGFCERKRKGYMVLKNRFSRCIKSILINT